MEENEKLLCEGIKSGFETLKTLTPGSEEYSEAVQSLERLYKLEIELTKAKTEAEVREQEDAHRKKECKSEVIRQYIRIGVDVIAVAAPIGYGIWVARTGFKFEETGTLISQTLRNSLPWYKPKM